MRALGGALLESIERPSNALARDFSSWDESWLEAVMLAMRSCWVRTSDIDWETILRVVYLVED